MNGTEIAQSPNVGTDIGATSRTEQIATAIEPVSNEEGGALRPDMLLIRTAAAPRVEGFSDEAHTKATNLISIACQALKVAAPQASSQRDYAGKFALLSRRRRPCEGQGEPETWLQTLGPYYAAPSSFRAYKAALCWGLRQQIRQALEDQLHAQQAHPRAWLHWVASLGLLVLTLHEIEKADRNAPRWAPFHEIKKRRGTSKKRDLKKQMRVNADCMDGMVDAMSTTKYGDAVQMLSLICCRPSELALGICLERASPDIVIATVIGKKVRKVAGQPWRKFELETCSLPPHWTAALDRDGSYTVNIDSPDALRKAMARRSRRVAPGAPAITAYSFRHHLPTTLRQQGASAEELAGILGHLVTNTQAGYGFKAGAKMKPPTAKKAIRSVQTARPIKLRDNSGLAKVLKNGTQAKKRTRRV